MHRRQVEEVSLEEGELGRGARVDEAERGGERSRVPCEGARRTAEHVAGQLIEEHDVPERCPGCARWVFRPRLAGEIIHAKDDGRHAIYIRSGVSIPISPSTSSSCFSVASASARRDAFLAGSLSTRIGAAA